MPNLHRRSRLMAGPALVAALAAAVAACGTSEAAPASGVEVTGAWARTTASGATTGVVYLTITGHQTDRLDSLTVDPSTRRSPPLSSTRWWRPMARWWPAATAAAEAAATTTMAEPATTGRRPTLTPRPGRNRP